MRNVWIAIKKEIGGIVLVFIMGILSVLWYINPQWFNEDQYNNDNYGVHFVLPGERIYFEQYGFCRILRIDSVDSGYALLVGINQCGRVKTIFIPDSMIVQ